MLAPWARERPPAVWLYVENGDSDGGFPARPGLFSARQTRKPEHLSSKTAADPVS